MILTMTNLWYPYLLTSFAKKSLATNSAIAPMVKNKPIPLTPDEIAYRATNEMIALYPKYTSIRVRDGYTTPNSKPINDFGSLSAEMVSCSSPASTRFFPAS